MKIIGLTGGVGSGKSTVAHLIKEHFHAHLIIADEVGYKFMQKGCESYNRIIDYFGTDILDEDSNIDRHKLSKLVFSNREQLEILNSFIHPYVKEEIIKEIKNLEIIDKDGIVIIESAILIEAGYQDICDEVWYVSSTIENRRKRLKISRSYSDKKIDAIINNQLAEEEFHINSHKTIYNNENMDKVMEQIQVLLVK